MNTRAKSKYQDIKLDLQGYVAWHWKTHKESPTFRDIQEEMKISSTSVVSYYLDKMVVEKLIFIKNRNIYPPGLFEEIAQTTLRYWEAKKNEKNWKLV